MRGRLGACAWERERDAGVDTGTDLPDNGHVPHAQRRNGGSSTQAREATNTLPCRCAPPPGALGRGVGSTHSADLVGKDGSSPTDNRRTLARRGRL